HAAMRAIALDEAEPPRRIAEKNKVLAEEPHRHRLVGHLLGEPDRPPIATQELAHRRARPDSRQKLVLGLIHCFLPILASSLSEDRLQNHPASFDRLRMR